MLEKLMAHAVASQLTQAVMAGVQEKDPMQRQIISCQVQVNFYEWIKQTLVDPAWPTPAIDSSWLSKAISGQGGAPSPSPLPGPLPGGIGPAAAAVAGMLTKAMKADPTFAHMLRINPDNPTGK